MDRQRRSASRRSRLGHRAYDADVYAELIRSRATNGGEFAKPAVLSKRFDYVLLPKRKFDGWFPRGRTHIIAGSSGVGKSRLTLAMLEAQLDGSDYLGHKGAGLDFLAIYADRGKLSNEEMLVTMGLEHIVDRIEHIPVSGVADAADASKTRSSRDRRRLPLSSWKARTCSSKTSTR